MESEAAVTVDREEVIATKSDKIECGNKPRLCASSATRSSRSSSDVEGANCRTVVL
jgi:hypothetical protein